YGARQLGADGDLQVPEPDDLSEDTGGKRLLLRGVRLAVSHGPHLVRRQARCRVAARRGARDRAWLDAGSDGAALARLLADVRGPARSRQPRDPEPRRRHCALVSTEQRAGARAAGREVEGRDDAADEVRRTRPRLPRGFVQPKSLPRAAYSSGGCRASE